MAITNQKGGVGKTTTCANLGIGLDQILFSANGQVITKTYTNTPARGSLKIIKKNNDGAYLSGVEFKLYDADQNELQSGTTDENGVLLFENLPVGDYFISEVTELPGYIPNHALQSARVGYHGCVEEITVTNYAAHGHVRVIKTDEAGNPLAGVHFKLTDTAENVVAEGDTDANGKIIFSMLPVGSYILVETSAPTGYVVDSTPIPIELTRDGEVVTKTITNGTAVGSISVIKTDAETGAALSGIHFVLADASGTVVGGGGTDESGLLTFSRLPLGTYTLTETETRNGYVLDETPREVTITANGQTVEVSITNTPARGSVSITKTDSETGAALAGVRFVLRDEAGALCAEGDTGTDGTLTLPNIPVGYYPKNLTGIPSLEKTLREAKSDTGKNSGTSGITDGYAHTGTASAGDVIEYQIISTLPSITSASTYLSDYTFVDTLSKGIAYKKGDVVLEFFKNAACTTKITTWAEADGKFARPL